MLCLNRFQGLLFGCSVFLFVFCMICVERRRKQKNSPGVLFILDVGKNCIVLHLLNREGQAFGS